MTILQMKLKISQLALLSIVYFMRIAFFTHFFAAACVCVCVIWCVFLRFYFHFVSLPPRTSFAHTRDRLNVFYWIQSGMPKGTPNELFLKCNFQIRNLMFYFRSISICIWNFITIFQTLNVLIAMIHHAYRRSFMV